MNIDKKLSHIEFLNREHNISHLSYDREMLFFQNIRLGNIEEVRRLYKPFTGDDMGKLSDDKLRNMKYHLIVTIALITRCCIEGGMEMETAYNLSDIYIRNLDACRTEEDVQQLHLEVIEDYTKRMQSVHKTTQFSKPIVICLDYIYDHLHTKISLEELAEQAGLSSSYLSRLFHKEVGLTISQYITGKRIQAAENLLKYSEYSFIEITNYLCFSSESHFIHTFKKYTGYTPKVYREIFFRTHWQKN